MNVCVQLTSLPAGGIECDVDLVLQSQENTAGQGDISIRVILNLPIHSHLCHLCHNMANICPHSISNQNFVTLHTVHARLLCIYAIKLIKPDMLLKIAPFLTLYS